MNPETSRKDAEAQSRKSNSELLLEIIKNMDESQISGVGGDGVTADGRKFTFNIRIKPKK